MNKSTNSTMSAPAVGLIMGGLGLAAGLLLAPKSGRETRRDVMNKSKDMKMRAEKARQEFKTRSENTVNNIKDTARDVKEDIKGVAADRQSDMQDIKDDTKKVFSATKEDAEKITKRRT